jgi:hypothetical protein
MRAYLDTCVVTDIHKMDSGEDSAHLTRRL